MNWYPPIDPDDLQNGSNRLDAAKTNGLLNKLLTNNESYQGLFPVYGDLWPYGQARSHSRDRRRTWHGGCDLMYALNTPLYPIGKGIVKVAKDADANGDANNRVVIEHDVGGKKVYSLYAHRPRKLFEVGRSQTHDLLKAYYADDAGIGGSGLAHRTRFQRLVESTDSGTIKPWGAHIMDKVLSESQSFATNYVYSQGVLDGLINVSGETIHIIGVMRAFAEFVSKELQEEMARG